MNPEEAGAPDTVWGDRPPPAHGETQRLVIGPLVIWLRTVENEIWLSHTYDTNADAGPPPPDDEAWSRWALSDTSYRIRVRPAFPDRLLVVKTEHPFALLRFAEARVYMRVPVWVRVEAVPATGRAPTLLTEVPSETLSETWWGDFLSGELGYWLETKARRSLSQELFEPNLALCVLQLTNHSQDTLRVEKLALRVEHLSIFEEGGRLWAEEVVVDYHGEAEGSEIKMQDVPPQEAGEARELSPARAQRRSFRARTFQRLKALSGLGGL